MKRLTVSLEERDYYRLVGRVRAGEADSKSDALRDIFDEYEELHSQRDSSHEAREDLHNEILSLESENQSIRTERDKLLGKLQAKQEELDDLREFRDRATHSLAALAPADSLDESGEVVDAEMGAREGSWWRFWR